MILAAALLLLAAPPKPKPLSIVLENAEDVRLELSVRHGGGTFACPKPVAPGESCKLAPMVAGPARLFAEGVFERDFTIGPRGGRYFIERRGFIGTLVGGGLFVAGGGAAALGIAGVGRGENDVRDVLIWGGALVAAGGLVAAIVDLSHEHGWVVVHESERAVEKEEDETDPVAF